MVASSFLVGVTPAKAWALASTNIPLGSPIYFYIEKLAGFGLVTSDIKGIRPYSRSEAARLLSEAEGNLEKRAGDAPPLALDVIARLRELFSASGRGCAPKTLIRRWCSNTDRKGHRFWRTTTA